jgi:DNA-binding response OmpR family regulator
MLAFWRATPFQGGADAAGGKNVKLLLVEDETRTARVLARGLAEEGHQVDLCETGGAALEQGRAIAYDVIVLDWTLPDLDGVTVLREWRARGVRSPVLLLTARGSTNEKVTGLRAGADDYLVKPFVFDELLARVEALHRRGANDAVARLGAVKLDARRRALVRGERSVTLTQREFQLLSELATRQGDVVTRTHLLRTVWSSDPEANPNVVDVYVGYVRSKLKRIADEGVAIEAVRGAGYRLCAPEAGP